MIRNIIVVSLLLIFEGALTSSTQLHLCGSKDDDVKQKYHNTGYGSQVIVPNKRLNFSGYISGWSAGTLVLTKSNYLELLTHTITFQVWRPSDLSGPASEYILVGSNQINFDFNAANLQDNITHIPGANSTALFYFENVEVPATERIHVISGDVIGWYTPPQLASVMVPLTVLYRNPNSHCTCLMYQYNLIEMPCTICFNHPAKVELLGYPDVSLSYVEDPEPQQHCSTSIRTCGISGSIDQTTDALESTQGLVQQPAADCHQATLLGIVILVAVGLILIIQIAVSIVCLAALMQLRKQVKCWQVTENSTQLHTIMDTSETKMADELIGHTDNDMYVPAMPAKGSATYEEI